jgi:hypothetical protein
MKAEPKISRKAIGIGGAYHPIKYDPLESNPLWHNVTGVEDSVYWQQDDVIWAKSATGPPDQLIAYGTDTPVDVTLSCTLLATPAGNQSELYLLVGRMVDFTNFVGFTIWAGELRVYERVAGSWDIPIGGTIPPAQALGRKVTMAIAGNTVTLTVEGVNSWSGPLASTAGGRIGMISRGWSLPSAAVIRRFAVE